MASGDVHAGAGGGALVLDSLVIVASIVCGGRGGGKYNRTITKTSDGKRFALKFWSLS